MSRLPAIFQFFRYASVGGISNLILYILYLAVTGLGGEPKLTMAILYVLGVSQTYWANRKWTFRFLGGKKSSIVRYFLVYLLGFLVNLSALYLLVDQWGLPHQIVQGCMIVVIAVMLFLLQKYWVFSAKGPGVQGEEPDKMP